MIYVHMKKLLPPVMAALLLASCGNNTLGTSEGAVSQEVTVTLGTSDTVQTSEAATVTEEVTEQTTTMPQLEFEDTPQNAYTRLTMSSNPQARLFIPMITAEFTATARIFLLPSPKRSRRSITQACCPNTPASATRQ